MTRSTKKRHGRFIAALLLSSSISFFMAPLIQAQARATDAAGLMREAQSLNREGLLAEATVSAQAAIEAGRKGGALDFTELDAGALLVDLLYKQARYDESRSAAEEQIAYWEKQAAANGASVRRDPRVTDRLGRAIEASMMAGERADVARYQAKLFAIASPDPGLWTLSRDEQRLRYDLADFSMPLILGQWKLTRFEPASKRDFASRLLFTQELASGRLSAEISLSYDEAQRKLSAAERQESLDAFHKRHLPSALEVTMPDLSFDGLASFKRGDQTECEEKECIKVYWLTLRGDWRMDIDVTFGSGDETQAAEQIRQLLAALQWRSAPPLFRERPMVQQIRDIESSATLPDGAAKAAELAEQALPDAYFSDEIARMHTYIGLSQYQRGNLDAARHSLGLAVPAWESAFKNEILYRSALDYSADIAYRQGRGQEAVSLNRKLIEWQKSDATLGWTVPKEENAFVNRRQGMHLPLRVGDYRLRPDTQNRFFYENLQTGAQLGLTVGVPQSSDQELESTLRAFMSKNLGLQAEGIHKTTFSPKSAIHDDSPPTGHKWEFDVRALPDGQGFSSVNPVIGGPYETPTKMAFWIVKRNGQRSLLRAPLTDNRRSRVAADQIAQALSW
jgi:tetratricopeptide (TPR) repeat protein